MTSHTPDAKVELVARETGNDVSDEMERIRELFRPKDGDAEDLITYAKEIVRLRALERSDAVMGEADRTAWLIEMEHDCVSRGSIAWFGIHYWHPTKGFSHEIDEALQFAREQDAEAFKREFKLSGKIVEHMWPAPIAPVQDDER